MLKIEHNIIAERYKQRMMGLTEEQRKALDAPLKKGEGLIKLKRSRAPISDGDIFVLSPKEGLYFYGRVILANLQHKDKEPSNWFNQGCQVVFIFRNKTTKKNLDGFCMDYDNLLVGPKIVSEGYWRRGYFETIGNQPLTEEEKTLDYGFFDYDSLHDNGTFVKANGEYLDHKPKFFNNYGINTYDGIYMVIKDEAIMDPDLYEV